MSRNLLLLFLVANLGMLSYVPSASAYNDNYGYQRSGINPQAWNQWKREKERKYQMEHTLERAPFPQTSSHRDLILVDLGKLSWAAYDAQGVLVKWGSASGGKSFCPDINKSCTSVTGTFTFYRKQGPSCKSNQFPVGRGGAPMPYCMHFHGGYALHGSGAVPDFNASHGCIRVPVHEAQWLNQHFVKVAKTRVQITY